ncbi:MAG: acylphosphatase [Bacteroidales bacterium]
MNFRHNTEKKARSMNLAGYVKNMPDGSVMIEAEGQQEDLDAFIQWAHQGPLWSKVEKVDVEYVDPRNYQDFKVKY